MDPQAVEPRTPTTPPVFQGGGPVLGVLPWMRRDALGLLLAAHKSAGDVVTLDFRLRKVTMLAHPQAVERVLVSHVKNYTKQTRGYDVLRILLGTGLVTSEGSFWLRQRRIAQPAFHKDKIAGFAQTMLACTDDMLAHWQTTHLRGGTFHVDTEMMALTMRIAGLTLMSTDVDEKASAVGDALGELIGHQVMQRVTRPFDLPMSWPTPMNRRFHKAKNVLDTIVMGIIAARRAGEEKSDLLSMLLNARDEETGEGMSDLQLRDELLTLFLAGHETTASSLAFTIWLLANHPEAHARARAEVDAVVGDGVVDVGAVMRMPYLEAVFSESMRLWPPIGLLARRCIAGDIIEGADGTRHIIAKDSLVFVSPLVTHRHPAFWQDPESFKPERFLPGGEAVGDDRPRYAWFPFSGGPRKCIGDMFARLEQKVCMARLLQRVQFASAGPVTPMLTISLRARDGVPMTVRPRTTTTTTTTTATTSTAAPGAA